MKNKGFTLVELLAVIAILAILVIIALPNVLKMFNDSKKNSFLTEAKTVYSEVSKKYISESMKGNKLTYVSSEDDTKLDMTGKSLKYCVLLNADGSVKSMKVSNGEWIAELPSGKKITDLKSSDLKDGNLDNEECGPKKPKTFKEDSWDTIANAVRSGQTSNYHIGDTKEVDLGTYYGKHKVRVANMSTPSECNQNGFSQSACGFVVEFADIIISHNMNPSGDYNGETYPNGWNKDGWPKSQMKTFVDNDIYSSLPNDLKGVIITTETVSGSGSEDTNNFTSTDKLYLLSTAEIWAQGTSNTINDDTARDKTRQLDYYKKEGVTTSSYAAAIKNGSAGFAVEWWLRCARSNRNSYFYVVKPNGNWDYRYVFDTSGISPAFRIG